MLYGLIFGLGVMELIIILVILGVPLLAALGVFIFWVTRSGGRDDERGP
jgi:cbb3-type cytochrome oxidase maturation protein